jgi:hypothetical protein
MHVAYAFSALAFVAVVAIHLVWASFGIASICVRQRRTLEGVRL